LLVVIINKAKQMSLLVMGNYLWCNLPVWCTCINYSIRRVCNLRPAGQMQYNKLDFYAGH